MKTTIALITSGFVILLFSIWGTAYALHLSRRAEYAWIDDPAIFTGVLMFGLGAGIIAVGVESRATKGRTG